jgi:hypothetical protein
LYPITYSIMIYYNVVLRYYIGALVGFTSLLSRVAYSLVNYVIMYNKVLKDYLLINFYATKLSTRDYYTKLNLLSRYYATTLFYLSYKMYYKVA